MGDSSGGTLMSWRASGRQFVPLTQARFSRSSPARWTRAQWTETQEKAKAKEKEQRHEEQEKQRKNRVKERCCMWNWKTAWSMMSTNASEGTLYRIQFQVHHSYAEAQDVSWGAWDELVRLFVRQSIERERERKKEKFHWLHPHRQLNCVPLEFAVRLEEREGLHCWWRMKRRWVVSSSRESCHVECDEREDKDNNKKRSRRNKKKKRKNFAKRSTSVRCHCDMVRWWREGEKWWRTQPSAWSRNNKGWEDGSLGSLFYKLNYTQDKKNERK